jgi:hypothetical protein
LKENNKAYQISKKRSGVTTLNRDRISKRSRVICPVEVSDRIVVHVAGDGISADAAVLLIDGRVVAVDRVAIVDGISIVAGIKTVSEKMFG